jgi:hypothetical protein
MKTLDEIHQWDLMSCLGADNNRQMTATDLPPSFWRPFCNYFR